jgi:type VI protein secretion system component Hcp
MKKGLLALVVIAVLSQSQVGISHAAGVEMFLYIPGLKGESGRPGRTDWTNVMNITWGQGQPAPGTATGSKVIFESVTVTKLVDSISPTFALAAASGQPFPQAIVEFVMTSADVPIVFARLEIVGIRVAQYKASSSGGGSSMPLESVGFSFNTIKWIVQRFNPAAGKFATSPPAVAGWDLTKNIAQ